MFERLCPACSVPKVTLLEGEGAETAMAEGAAAPEGEGADAADAPVESEIEISSDPCVSPHVSSRPHVARRNETNPEAGSS